MRRSVMVATVLACVVAAPVHAQTTSRTAEAIRVATSKWGVPCAGDVTYTWGPVESPYAGWASWSYLLPDPGPLGWTDCKVTIDHRRAQQWRDKNWRWYCTLVLHEHAHLVGVGHSDNPRSVMAPVITIIWRHCATAARARGW